MNITKYRLKDKNLYAKISIETFPKPDLFLDTAANTLKQGTNILQIETKSATQEVISILGKVRELCSIFNSLLIITSRIDIAQLTGADGVLLTNNDFCVEDARKITDENFIIGVEQDIINVPISCADYILCTENLTKEIHIPIYKSIQNKSSKLKYYKLINQI